MKYILSPLLFLVTLCFPQTLFADSTPFLPTWRLLTKEQKQQFISGYVQGWRDAGKVTDVALDHIRKNPEQAVKALESIQNIYELSHLGPDLLAREVDDFYAEPDNSQASLSVAISSSR
ncbi:MAG: hypothetical protein KDD55_07090 [Bdellovibrionales bacterium]|nr:hypothetical protein [Bdellovibrionales bacterium]